MKINKLILDLDTFNLRDKDLRQPLVVGQKDFYKFEFIFVRGEEIITDPNWNVRVIFERPDGEKSNEMVVLLNNQDRYIKKISYWASDVVGELKISILVDDLAFAIIRVPVRKGLTPSDETITEMQYQALLGDLDALSPLLERNIEIENGTNFSYNLRNFFDATLLNPLTHLFLTLPESIKHGYWAGVNFITDTNFSHLSLINNVISKYPLIIIKYNQILNEIQINPNKIYNLTFYCDGLSVICHYLEIPR